MTASPLLHSTSNTLQDGAISMHSALSGASLSVGGKRHVSEVSALTFADLDSTGAYEPAHCRLINDSTLTSISSSSGTLISAGWDRSLQVHAVAGVSTNKGQDPAKRSIGQFVCTHDTH
jgi:hypothetical protein